MTHICITHVRFFALGADVVRVLLLYNQFRLAYKFDSIFSRTNICLRNDKSMILNFPISNKIQWHFGASCSAIVEFVPKVIDLLMTMLLMIAIMMMRTATKITIMAIIDMRIKMVMMMSLKLHYPNYSHIVNTWHNNDWLIENVIYFITENANTYTKHIMNITQTKG